MGGIWVAEVRNKQNRMKLTACRAIMSQGFNFLLSNQQDKAVDLFLDMLKEDTGTVEAHLTLGNLFRSRGEVDRAIRIHQTLMEALH
ncbi:tetratricopeptide repeat protein [Salmonella enterica subsp. enterica]|uniref:Tetratricopeptide repeat protein n=1 Tax=Salmonella enterica I TaxID=59201 RepID=A0A379VR06_SALET|nr:tetratricopeptide repeat protein [Salmonella enterica subsp. enterica]